VQALALFGQARLAWLCEADAARARQLGDASLVLLLPMRHRRAAEVQPWLALLPSPLS